VHALDYVTTRSGFTENKISVTHGDECEYDSLLGYCDFQYRRSRSTFRRSLLLPSSGRFILYCVLECNPTFLLLRELH
jgi:hypothetical protein